MAERLAPGDYDQLHHFVAAGVWKIGEYRPSGEKKYYLANLPAKMGLRMLAAIIKARWICEQAHQQLKEELGLDHFEGRSWQGLHRHALMTMIAYAFLQHRRLIRGSGKKKKINGPPPQPTLPAVRHAIVDLIMRPLQRCPNCRRWVARDCGLNSICQSSAIRKAACGHEFRQDRELLEQGVVE